MSMIITNNNGRLTVKQLYQQYLNGRRNFSINQRQRLLQSHPEIAGYLSQVSTQSFAGQLPNPIIVTTPRPRTNANNFNLRRRGVSNFNINQNRFAGSFPARSSQNSRDNVCGTDIPLVNTTNIGNGDTIRLIRSEFLMDVYANYKAGQKDPNGDNIVNNVSIHPANFPSAGALAQSYSQWRLNGFTLRFHTYLGSHQNATVWIAIDYDFHNSTVPVGWATAMFSNSKNFTVHEPNIMINSDTTYDVGKTYRCDNILDEHETVIEQTPCRVIANAHYTDASGAPPNLTVGYVTIDYDIEFLHIRVPDKKHTIPRNPTDGKSSFLLPDDASDTTVKPGKFSCLSLKKG